MKNVNPETALSNWRERLQDIADEAAGHLGKLPFVKGIVLGGSVARGDAWPISDVDFVVVWQPAQFGDVEEWLRREENMFNAWLEKEGKPNHVDWDHTIFECGLPSRLSKLSKPEFWKAVADPTSLRLCDLLWGSYVMLDHKYGMTELCEKVAELRFHEKMLELRLQASSKRVKGLLKAVRTSIEAGNVTRAQTDFFCAASEVVVAFYDLMAQQAFSPRRCLSRLGRIIVWSHWEPFFEKLLGILKLDENSTLRRLKSAPEGLRETVALELNIRREIGEPVSELDVARDALFYRTGELLTKKGASPLPWCGLPVDTKQLGNMVMELERIVDAALKGTIIRE